MSENGSLILARKAGESLTITTSSGEQIILHIDKTSDAKTKLRIEAPAAVQILRTELLDQETIDAVIEVQA